MDVKNALKSFAYSATLASLLLGLSAGCNGCDDDIQAVVMPGSISGAVCDPGQGVGIFGATVRVIVIQPNGSEKIYETLTDAEGNFLLEDVPVGTHSVHIRRGSFRSEVEGVEVFEEQETVLDGECVAPVTVAMAVYGGHDSVEEVLTRLGYTSYAFIETYHRASDRDDGTPSWLVEQFGDIDNFSSFDILFINCGAHEWALEKASDAEVETVLNNLRVFVNNGGSIYMSDWAYDLMELLYPDAVDWYDDDEVENAAQVGEQQDFLGLVADEDMLAVLDKDRVSLRYNQGRIAMPVTLGEGSRALITANNMGVDVDAEDLDDVPVLLEHVPVGVDEETAGRIIFTTFHNGSQNTPDMDEILRAIVFSL